MNLKKNFFVSVLSVLFVYFQTASAAVYTLHPSQRNLLANGSLNVFTCGTGDPEVQMQMLRKPSCLAVLGDHQFLLFDAGEGSIQTLASMGMPINQLDTVFISHWHSDHFSGLAQVINASWIRGRKKPILIYGPEGVNKVVSSLAQAYKLDTIFRAKNRHGRLNSWLASGTPVRVKATKKSVRVYKKGQIEVYAFLVNHRPVTPAFGYRLQYGNCNLVYSGDTKVVPSLEENAKNADVLINEAYSNAYYKKSVKRAEDSKNPMTALETIQETKHYHSDTIALAKMAEKAHVKHLFLTHLVPAIGVSTKMKNSFIAGMRKYYHGPITVTDDRDLITLTPGEKGRCVVKYTPAKQPSFKIYPIQKK